MLKAKGIINIEIDQVKTPSDWLNTLQESITNSLNNTLIHFGTESKGVVNIKGIEVTEVKEKMEE